MEKRVITKEAVEHAKKVLELYEKQEIEKCPKCKNFKSFTTTSYGNDHNNERCESENTSYYCKHPSVMENKHDLGKYLYDDSYSFKKSDKKCPKWCPLHNNLKS